MDIYRSLSDVYVSAGLDRYSLSLGKAVLRFCRRSGYTPRSVLDLCCGTGALAAYFAGKGLSVSGIDLSPEMIARAKALHPELAEAFSVVDAASFRPTRRADLVTCADDSVNHLTEEAQLAGLFRAAAAALPAGGLFIFDAVNPEELVPGLSYSARGKGLTRLRYEILPGEQPECVKIRLSLKGQVWEQTERLYPPDRLWTLLAEAGFDPVFLGTAFCGERSRLKLKLAARKR